MPDEALRQLCSTSKTFLGAFAMICIICSVLLFIANYFMNSGKPKTSKKTRLWLAGAAILAIAAISIAAYILAPLILKAHGIEPVQGCDVSSTQEYVPPYCGNYCHNQSVPKSSENCTCLMY